MLSYDMGLPDIIHVHEDSACTYRKNAGNLL